MHAQLYGRPQVDAKGEPVTTDENEDGDKFEGGGLGARFTLWRDVLIDGKPWLVGGKSPLVPESRVTAKYAGRRRRFGPMDLSERRRRRNENESQCQGRRSLGLVAAALGGRRSKSANALVAQLPAGSVSDSSRRGAADAEVQHEFQRGQFTGRILRGPRQCADAVRVRFAHHQRLSGGRRAGA